MPGGYSTWLSARAIALDHLADSARVVGRCGRGQASACGTGARMDERGRHGPQRNTGWCQRPAIARGPRRARDQGHLAAHSLRDQPGQERIADGCTPGGRVRRARRVRRGGRRTHHVRPVLCLRVRTVRGRGTWRAVGCLPIRRIDARAAVPWRLRRRLPGGSARHRHADDQEEHPGRPGHAAPLGDEPRRGRPGGQEPGERQVGFYRRDTRPPVTEV